MSFLQKAVSVQFVFITFLVLLFVSGMYAGIDVFHNLLFSFVQIFGVLMPGCFILHFTKAKLDNSLSLLFSSYAIGYSLLAVIYALMIYSNFHTYSKYALYVICIVSFFLSIKNKSVVKSLFARTDDDKFVLIIFLLTILIGFIVYQYPYRSPLQTGYQDMFFDNLYWVKNCISSTRGYPLPELSVLGNNLYWHLFSCFNIALYHLSTGIEIYDLCFSLSYIWQFYLLVGCAYVMFSYFIKNKKYLKLSIVILLFCSSIEPYTQVYYLSHLYGTKLAVNDGMALSMLAFTFFVMAIKDNLNNIPLALVTMLLYVGAIGFKVPNGLTVLIGVWAYLFYDFIIYKKINLKMLSFCILCVIFFLVVNNIFVIDGNALVSQSSSHKLTLDFSTTLRSEYMQILYNKIISLRIGTYIAFPLVSIFYILFVHPIMLLFWAILFSLIFIKCKDKQYYNNIGMEFSLFGITIFGCIVFLAVGHPGFSQSYFLFAIYPFALLFSLVIAEKYLFRYYKTIKRFLFVLILFSVGVNLLYAKRTFSIENKYSFNKIDASKTGTSVSKEEVVGLRWIRNNTPIDAILATNKVIEPESGKKSFVTSVYSERQVYLEGYVSTNLPNDYIVDERMTLLKNYFNGDRQARKTLIEEGVDYVVVYKNISDAHIEKSNILYENKDIIIAKI